MIYFILAGIALAIAASIGYRTGYRIAQEDRADEESAQYYKSL